MAKDIKIRISANSNQAVGAFDKLGGSIVVANQALGLLSTAADAVSAPFAAIVSEGRSFEKQMSAVRGVSKLTSQEFKNLSDLAKEIGATTQFTATQAGEGIEALARAGQNTTEIMSNLETVMQLSAATGLQLGDAADLVAVQLNIFEKEGLGASKAVDLLARTTNASAQDIFSLREALRNSAGTAASFGIEFEELTVILGAMANAGVRGERAGTALNAALARLANPTKEVSDVLNQFNITLDQVNPATNDFSQIIDVLSKSGMEAKDIMQLLGQEAGPKFASLISQGSQAFNQFAEAQRNANSASDSASERINSLDGDITLLKSSLSGLANTIFEAVSPELRSMVQTMSKAATATKEFFDLLFETGSVNTGQGRLAEIATANKNTGALVGSLEDANLALQNLNVQASGAFVSFFTSPVLEEGPKELVKSLQKSSDITTEISKKTSEISAEQQRMIDAGLEEAKVRKIILENLTKQEQAAKNITEESKKQAEFNSKSAASGAAGKVAGQVTGGGSLMQGLMAGDPITGLMMAIVDNIIATEAMQAAFGSFNDALGEIFEPIGEAFAPIIEAFADFILAFKPITEALGRWIKNIVAVPTKIIEFWTGAFNEVGKAFEWFGNLIDAEFAKFVERNRDTFDHHARQFEAFTENTKAFFTWWGNHFASQLSDIFSGFAVSLDNFGLQLQEAFDWLVDSIKSLFGDDGGGSKKRTFLGMDIGTFHSGTTQPLGSNDLVTLPGMQSNEGLALLQQGEQVVPANGDMSNISGGGSSINMTFNIRAINPSEQRDEIAQMLEEMVLTGRLNLNAA